MQNRQAVIYARMGSRPRKQEENTIPAQLELLRYFASENGFDVVREFSDVGGRDEFNEMLRYLDSNTNCRNVLVGRTDRLTRNIKELFLLEELDFEIYLVKQGCKLSETTFVPEDFFQALEMFLANV